MTGIDEVSKGIRENPPFSVETFEQRMVYEQLYDDITNNGVVLQFQDRYALAELAINLVELKSLRADIAERGTSYTVEGDKGSSVTKRNPSIDVIQKIQPIVIRLFDKFKMNPGARKTNSAPVGAAGPGGNNDGWDDV